MGKFWPRLDLITEGLSEEERELLIADASAVDGYTGLEENEPLRVYLEARSSHESAMLAAASAADAIATSFPSVRIETEAVPEEDWGAGWRDYFKLTRVGNRLYSGPPWDCTLPEEAPPDAVVVRIDPGQAFGTGTHETTRLCLRIMEERLPPQARVLDMGAGSGILSIAAALLGAEFCAAIEFDPVAEENFWLNARLNATEGRVKLILADTPRAALKDGPFDLAICNMLSVRFLPHLDALREAGAPLILSGLLAEEQDEIAQAVRKAGFQHVAYDTEGEWGAFYLK